MKVEQIVADKLNWPYRIARQSGQYMELEIFKDLKPTTLRRTFYQQAQNADICLKPDALKGSRSIFSKAKCN